MTEPFFAVREDYVLPLLQTLSELPGGSGKTQYVLERLFETYHHRIPPEHMELLGDDRPRWEKHVQWCRYNLNQSGDMDGEHGIWHITSQGRERLSRQPNSKEFSARRSESPSKPTSAPSRAKTAHVAAQTQASRPTPTPGRPASDSVSGTPTSDQYVILDTQIKAIREFLRGRVSRPKDDKLCDWVHFCYIFELYREAYALFQLIEPTQVNAWYYDRTKRLAVICQMKAAGQA